MVDSFRLVKSIGDGCPKLCWQAEMAEVFVAIVEFVNPWMRETRSMSDDRRSGLQWLLL